MNFVKSLFMRAFGRPTGLLGTLGGIIMAHTNRRMAQRAIELLDVQPNEKVLEIGFGPGVGIELLAHSASLGWVTGIDPSEEMVEQASARNAAAIAAGRVVLQRGSVERLPFEDSTFDKALAVNSMQVWPNAIAGLREIRRVLRPGGCVVLGFTRHSGQAKEGLSQTLTAAGLAYAHIREDEMADGDFCAAAVKPLW
jgi:ubiquinone/menaquinone biosynthesis C-methylase UbiE